MPDSKFANYYYNKVSAKVKVDGKEFPCSGISVTYALGTIPTGNLSFAVGRSLSEKTFNQVAETMTLITDLTPFVPVEVFLTVEPQPADRAAPPGKDKGFPSGEFRVFTGFLGSPRMSKTYGSASATLDIGIFGAPAGLAGSTQNVVGATIGTVGGGGENTIINLRNYSPSSTMYNALCRSLDIRSDVYTEGLKKLMDAVTLAKGCFIAEDNATAKVAIERINKGGVIPKSNLSLGIAPGGAFKEMLQSALTKTIIQDFWNMYKPGTTITLWDAMADFTRNFKVSFVPAVEEDAVVALTPNLGGDAWAVIDPSEYFNMGESANFSSPNFFSYITSVALGTTGFSTSPWQNKTAIAGILGAFSINSKLKARGSGQLLKLNVPPWLIPPGAPGKSASNPGGAVPDKGNAQDIPPPPPDKLQGEREATFFTSAKLLGNAYCETVLHEVLFGHREMSISGRLRLDIAPGSLVQVNTIGERFTNKKDKIYGSVLSTTLNVGTDGQTGVAQTTFNITHLRSSTEHKELTTKKHPMYPNGDAYRGAKLLKY